MQKEVIKEKIERDKNSKTMTDVRRDNYETFDTASILRRRLQRIILVGWWCVK